jgi:hypothetical protein
MRLSAHPNDRDAWMLWNNFVSQGYQVTVFLDGQKIAYPITADSNEGWIEAYMQNANGDPIRHRQANYIHRVALHGDVHIMLTNQ